MPTKEEILETIAELQNKAPTYSTCEKLATFYTLLSHLYSDNTEVQGYSYSTSSVFPASNGSEFREAIAGKDIESVVDVLDEHMDVIKILFPKEYKSVIQRIGETQK